MEKLRIIICDENISDSEGYAGICRSICDASDMPAEIKCYTNTGDFLFDMNEDTFAPLVSIMIVDPDGAFAPIPANFRKTGYDGLILYLTNSEKKEHWLSGYDVGAFNYVFKGTDNKSLNRFHNVFKKSLDAANQLVRQYLVLRSAGVYKQIEVKDILFFEGVMDHVVRVDYKGGNFEFRSDIKKLEERLGESGFIRPHQSFVVAIDAISTMTQNELTMNDGRTVPIGRSFYPALKTAIDRWRM